MIKTQPAIPILQHTVKALLKSGEQAAAKSASRAPDNVRTRAETLNDSLEEIGSMFSEKMESKTKASNRRQMQGNLLRHKNAVSKIEHLNQLFQLLDSNDSQQLDEQLGQLREALKQTPPPDSEELLEKMGGDPTRCDLLLRMVKEEAAIAGDRALADAASQQLKQLQHQHGEAIRAGNNTALALAGLTSDAQEKQALRNIYYQSIVHQQSALMMLDMLLEQVDPQQFVPTLRTLQQALADDFAALAPSISSGSLRRILHGLRDAAELNHTLAASHTLLKQLAAALPHAVEMSAVELTRRLLQFSHHGVYGSDFQQLGGEVAGEQPQQLSRFFSRLFPLVHQLPLSLWLEQETRNTALQLLRGLITELAKVEKQPQLRHSA